jgi:hypothetical protein
MKRSWANGEWDVILRLILVQWSNWRCCQMQKPLLIHLFYNRSCKVRGDVMHSACWTRNRSFIPLKSPSLSWPGISFWAFPSFPNHFLYPATPFSYVRSPTIASSTPNPPLPEVLFPKPAKLNYVYMQGQENSQGRLSVFTCVRGRDVELCLTWYDASSMCVLHIILCMCFESNVACVPGATDAKAYLLIHSSQCFSDSLFFSLLIFFFCGGTGMQWSALKDEEKRKRNTKWKSSEIKEGEHRLVNRLLSHVRIYLWYLSPLKRGIHIQVYIFTVMSDMSTCQQQRTVWYSLPAIRIAVYSIIYEISKLFGVCFL